MAAASSWRRGWSRPTRRETAGLDRAFRGVGFHLAAEGEPVDLATVESTSRAVKSCRRLERCRHRPIFARAKDLDLALAVAIRRRATDCTRPADLPRAAAPQDRRKREADQIIERPARPIGVDEVLIEVARMLHRLGHRGVGDGVEGHPLDLGGKRLLAAKHLAHVPADRFALAVRIRGENQRVRGLRLIRDRLHLLRTVGRDLPQHLERVVGIDRAVLGGRSRTWPKLARTR